MHAAHCKNKGSFSNVQTLHSQLLSGVVLFGPKGVPEYSLGCTGYSDLEERVVEDIIGGPELVETEGLADSWLERLVSQSVQLICEVLFKRVQPEHAHSNSLTKPAVTGPVSAGFGVLTGKTTASSSTVIISGSPFVGSEAWVKTLSAWALLASLIANNSASGPLFPQACSSLARRSAACRLYPEYAAQVQE